MPVRLDVASDWKATDWLGIVTAGMLWTSVCLGMHFDESIGRLAQQIRQVAQLECCTDGVGGQEPMVQSLRESVAELKRLEVDIKGAARAGGETKWDKEEEDGRWRDRPAKLHPIIPELPPDFRLTNDIEMLTQLVLGQGQSHKRAVGFFGMGGAQTLHPHRRSLRPQFPPTVCA